MEYEFYLSKAMLYDVYIFFVLVWCSVGKLWTTFVTPWPIVGSQSWMQLSTQTQEPCCTCCVLTQKPVGSAAEQRTAPPPSSSRETWCCPGMWNAVPSLLWALGSQKPRLQNNSWFRTFKLQGKTEGLNPWIILFLGSIKWRPNMKQTSNTFDMY